MAEVGLGDEARGDQIGLDPRRRRGHGPLGLVVGLADDGQLRPGGGAGGVRQEPAEGGGQKRDVLARVDAAYGQDERTADAVGRQDARGFGRVAGPKYSGATPCGMQAIRSASKP